MNILVTGGAGYIGSHFCKQASGSGHKVVVFDNLTTGHEKFVKFGPLVKADIREEQKLIDAMKQHHIEAVVHFAAKSLVAESMKSPDLYFDNNVRGTYSLLQAMRHCQVKLLLFSSSAAVYGAPAGQPIKEDTAKTPVNPYGQSKLECERLIMKFAKENDLKTMALRYFNVMGQDPEKELWEDHEPETHVIPNMMKAHKNKSEFSIFGEDYETMDGTCIRDYVDVNDLALVHLEALKKLQNSEDACSVSNVGQGRGYSVKEIVGAFTKTFGPLKIRVAPRRPGDPDALISDVTYFQSWYPHQLKTLAESLETLRVKS